MERFIPITIDAINTRYENTMLNLKAVKLIKAASLMLLKFENFYLEK